MKLSEIEAKKRRLQAELAQLEGISSKGKKALSEDASPELIDAPTESARAQSGSVRPLRDVVIDALQEIGFMTYGQQLSMYIRARFGREVPSTRFGTLSVDEEKAFRRGSSRPVWLCHGLTHDRGEAVKRLWARSDWGIADRIVTPLFGRAQYLRATARFATLAMDADGFAAEPDLLRFIAADHARDLGVLVRRGEFAFQEWGAAAEKELSTIASKEREAVDRFLSTWSTRPEPVEQLFGRPPRPIVVAAPVGERQA